MLIKNTKTGFQKSALATALSIALTMSAATAVSAQEVTPKPEDTATTAEGKKKLDTVKVVGSRIKRSEIEGPAPVTVITGEQMELEGFNTVFDAIETLTQNTGAAQNDFNAAGGFTPNASVINLRGLGPGRTLLLINGRRANDYPFPYNGRSNAANYNSIPAAAVDRIEVLTGGASAIYGSDAVAGVVNVVLKSSYDGQSVQLKAQTSSDGGRDLYSAQFVGGLSGDNWNFLYTLEAYKSEELFAYERDSFDSAEDNPAPPGVNGAPGLGGYQPPIGIQLRRVSKTNATVSYSIPTGYDCSASSLYRKFNYSSSASGAIFGDACGFDQSVSQQSIANGNEDFSTYLLGDYTFDNDMQIWGSFTGFQSHSELSGGTEFWQNGPQPGAAIYDPTLGYRVIATRVFTPETYGGSKGTNQKFDEKSWEFAVGLRGTIAEKFDWDVTASHAEYQADRERPRLTVAGTEAYFLGPKLGTVGPTGAYSSALIRSRAPDGTAVYNINLAHLYGEITPEDYAAMSTTVTYDGQSENSALSFSIAGDLFELPAGPLGVAAVVEASEQSYELITDPRIFPSVREVYNLTGTGGGGERSRYAAGLEFSIPIFASLKLSLSGRFDSYDDITQVDDAKTWGAGLEWRPFSNLLLRGNYATSFKAPDMHYVFSEPSGSFGTVVDFSRCERDGISAATCSGAGGTYNYTVFTTSQGNPGLSEETGDSWSMGLVWDVIENLSLTVDYYQVNLNDEVTVQSGSSIVGDEYGCITGMYTNGTPFPYAPGSSYCQNINSLIDRDSSNDDRLTEIRSGPINIAYRSVTGIDGSLRYFWDTDSSGKYSASIAWSHVLEQELQSRAGADILSYRDFNTNSDFRSRVRATLSWSKDDWDATVFMNRLGSFPLWAPNNYGFTGTPVTPPTNPPTFNDDATLSYRTQPYFTYNLTAGYRFNEDFSMRLSVNNIFNNTGGFDPTFNSYPYTWSGYDLIGRTYGLQANYSF